VLVAHAESDGRLEMRDRVRALVQGQIRASNVVMARRSQVVQSDSFGEHLDREPVTAGCLIDDAEKIQTGHVRGIARQNLLANGLGLGRSPVLVGPLSLGHQIGNVGRRGACSGPAARNSLAVGNGLAARNSGPTLSSAHANQRSMDLCVNMTLCQHPGYQQPFFTSASQLRLTPGVHETIC
jgi:hypothetical protein